MSADEIAAGPVDDEFQHALGQLQRSTILPKEHEAEQIDKTHNKKIFLTNYLGKKNFNSKLRTLCDAFQADKQGLNHETRVQNSQRMFNALRPLFGFRKSLEFHDPFNKKMGEKGVAIWAFAQTNAMQCALLSFLQGILLPRIFVFAETKPAQVEALFLTRLESLTGLNVHEFEEWFERFSNLLNTSAGVTILESYLDPAMLTCIDRIEHGRIETLRHNFQFHADFLKLYRTKLQAQHERANVNLATNGLEFTPSEMIALYHQNRTLRASLLQQNALERRFFHSIQEQNNNNSIALQIVQGLFLTNAIPQAARDDIQALLLPRSRLLSHEEANRVAMDRLFVCFTPWANSVQSMN